MLAAGIGYVVYRGQMATIRGQLSLLKAETAERKARAYAVLDEFLIVLARYIQIHGASNPTAFRVHEGGPYRWIFSGPFEDQFDPLLFELPDRVSLMEAAALAIPSRYWQIQAALEAFQNFKRLYEQYKDLGYPQLTPLVSTEDEFLANTMRRAMSDALNRVLEMGQAMNALLPGYREHAGSTGDLVSRAS